MVLSQLEKDLEEISNKIKIFNVEEIKEKYPLPDGFTLEEYWKFHIEQQGFSFMTLLLKQQIRKEFDRKYRPEQQLENLKRMERNKKKQIIIQINRHKRTNKKNST